MALDLPLPRNLLVHGHWTMNREKMSKSAGNVVNPFFAIDRFGDDTMRFFLIYQGALTGDADYDNEFIVRDYKKCLQHGIGNLASRTVGVAKGTLGQCVADAVEGRLPVPTSQDLVYQQYLEGVPSNVAREMEGLNPSLALHHIMSFVGMVSKTGYGGREGKRRANDNLAMHRASSISSIRSHG